mmetsp:Transcript_97595/g.271522  ORF Transcript_97595/g.271522 Transcript_97595/m.271522 type:complete len:545 (+) Transcript_97595:100-1734(+)
MYGVTRRLGGTGGAPPVPTKRLKTGGGSGGGGNEPLKEVKQEAPHVDAGETYEVRYASSGEAEAALQLHGSEVQGKPVSVSVDPASKDGTKVLVSGLPAVVDCEELKAHFSGVGAVIYAGPPKKPGGKGPANGIGEVRYETPEEAQQAVSVLNGSVIEGATISAMLDQSSKDNSKLIITGLPSGLQWQELKDHCAQGGRVAYVNVKQGPPLTGAFGDQMEGEVRFDAAEHAQTAMQKLNGSVLGGRQIWIRADPNSKDHTRLIVTGFPQSIQWQELKDHFSSIGTVAFAQVKPSTSPQVFMPAPSGKPAMSYGGYGPWGGRLPPPPPMVGKGMYGKLGTQMYGKPVMMGGYYDLWYGQAAMAPNYGVWPGAGRPPAAQGGKGSTGWTGSSGGLGSGEVRFDNPSHAQTAINKLNGSLLQGCRLSVCADETSQDGSKVVVHGIPVGCQWQELKDHFSQIGQVAFASIVGPGEVRMESIEEAQRAVNLLDGAEVLGSVISVNMDRSSKDGTRLVVNNLPSSVNWQQMKDIFSQAGTVAFATRLEAR